MRRVLTGLGGAVGVAALWRLLTRRARPATRAADPAEELRRKLAAARDIEADRESFDAAEGVPVDEVEEPRSLEERRRAVHEQAQEALGRMRPDAEE